VLQLHAPFTGDEFPDQYPAMFQQGLIRAHNSGRFGGEAGQCRSQQLRHGSIELLVLVEGKQPDPNAI
jgi:hypothetical protein